MATQFIDRSNDEEIIDIVRSVMDNGTGKAETVNEHILIKLLQIRNTPIRNFKFDQEKVDFHFNQWKKPKVITIEVDFGALRRFSRKQISAIQAIKELGITHNPDHIFGRFPHTIQITNCKIPEGLKLPPYLRIVE